MKPRTMKKIFYTLTAAVLCLTACHKEMTESIPAVVEPEMATVTVPFTVTIPVSPEAVTRADRYLLNMEEPVINNLYIAVFGENGGMLQQFVPAALVGAALQHAGYAYQCEYTAQLPLYDDECHLHFIANYDGDISTLTFDYEKDFMDNLSKTIVTTEVEDEVTHKKHYPITSMPDAYWQKVVLEDGIKATYNSTTGKFELDKETKDKLTPIALVRNYAKITVTSASREFSINSYALVNVPRQGTIAPWQAPEKTIGFSNIFMEIGKYCDGTTYNTDPAYKDDPTYPPYHNFVEDIYASDYIGYMPPNSMIYTDNPGEISAKNPRDTDNGLYMYERTVPTKAGEQTGVIVCITWASLDQMDAESPNRPYAGQTMYYKIEVLDQDGEYMPILRNIHYNINLKSITGEGESSFDKAFDGPFFGNISSSIETATLTSINNTRQQIVVNRMDYTSFDGGDVVDIYVQFYPEMRQAPSSNTSNYLVNNNSILSVSGYNQAIASVGDIEYITEGAFAGWMHVEVTLKPKPTDASEILRGKLRVQGVLDGGIGSLYRDIVFTVMSPQNFTSDSKVAVDGDEVTVTIGLPRELPYSLFPLQVTIEAFNNNLSTNDSKLPVGYGPTAFDALDNEPAYSAKNGKNSFYFIRTIQYKDYAITSSGSYEYVTKIDCPFIHTDDKAIVVKLNEESGYFNEKTLTP